jgi:pseudouridine-5'-phosphate glycosidase
MRVLRRAAHPAVALETALLTHGVPAAEAPALARTLARDVRSRGCEPAFTALLDGQAIVGLTDDEITRLLSPPGAVKLNSGNLGPALHLKSTGSTTVSATLELAAAAGLRVIATGGIGGVSPGPAAGLDISADLAAITRFPLAVVCSGVKGIHDVPATRETLESLGVCVVGFGTDRFPAFYVRDGGADVDARFDEIRDLARFLRFELARTGRGVLVVCPIDAASEIPPAEFASWLARANEAPGLPAGRARTPALLARLHDLSAGRTLAANIALVRTNALLAAGLSAAMGSP